MREMSTLNKTPAWFETFTERRDFSHATGRQSCDDPRVQSAMATKLPLRVPT